MRAIVAGMLAGAGLVLTGCGNAQTSGIVAIGPDTYAVETRGRALAGAVERGLTEATSFCTAQSRQTELLGTRINADSYQVAFRCVGGGGLGGSGLAGNPGIIGRVPVGYGQRNSSLGPIPVSAPIASSGGTVIRGQAFPPAQPPPPGFDLGTVGAIPGRTATVAGNPFAQQAPTRQVAAASSLPPLSSLPANAAFQAPIASAPQGGFAPQASSAPVATSPFQPLQSPLGVGSPAPASFSAPPAFSAVSAPAPAPAFAPLSSPLGATPASAPVLQPLGQASSAPAFQPLSQPQPIGSLPGASSALQPVASPRAGPAAVPAAASAGAPLGQPSTLPPAGFWNAPAR